MKNQETYKHIETDDSALSLHDCRADRIELKNSVLSFYFSDGFWITPSHVANDSSDTVRTDPSQVNFHIYDDVWVYVFKKNILGQTIRTELTLEKFIRLVNNQTFTLEILYQYKKYNGDRMRNTHLLKCFVRTDKKPYFLDCQLWIPTSKTEYLWNELLYDRKW